MGRKSTDTPSISSSDDDDKVLQEIGYVPSFRREFSNLATVSKIIFCSHDRNSFTRPCSDQFRVQYNGSMLQYRDDLQHTTSTRRAIFSDLVLDIGSMHVLYPR